MSNQANNSRRKFIKTTGAVAGITIIPTSSVWGACNATGISGGSKALDIVCEVPLIEGGWPPSTWEKLTKAAACNDMRKAKKKIKTIFGDTSDTLLESYIAGMAAFLATENVEFGDGFTCESISFNLAQVLDREDTGGGKRHLAAMYLNIYFGVAEWDETLNPSAALVLEDFWGSMCVEYGDENKDATPRWTAPEARQVAQVIRDQYWDEFDTRPFVDPTKIPKNNATLECP